MVEYAGKVDVSNLPQHQRLAQPPTANVRDWRNEMAPPTPRVRARGRRCSRLIRLRTARRRHALSDPRRPAGARPLPRSLPQLERDSEPCSAFSRMDALASGGMIRT